MENMICNRIEEMEQWLVPYIDRPIYVKGHCWGKLFDGWTIIYDEGKNKFRNMNLMFDYRGKQYSVYGFLPSRYTQPTSSTYNNAFYEPEI